MGHTNPFPSTPDLHTPSDDQRLLAIARALARELRPGAGGLDRLGLDHGLERDFGLDSLARMELLARIERELGARLSEAAFAGAETPRDLLRLMGAKTWAEIPDLAPASGTAETRIDHPPPSITTLPEMLDWHVARHGDRVHIRLVLEEGGQDITYRMLQSNAQRLAAGLLAQGLQGGDRVAVMLPTGSDFFTAFYGALYAGCAPAPLYPPTRPSQIEDHMRRIAGIISNAGAVMLITDERAKPLGHLLRAQCRSLRDVVTAADLSGHGGTARLPPPPGSRDIAFLQYTSGSTGNPKGVVLTHANLLANLRAMEQASGVTAGDIFVSWLPLYHDMGLIGACMGSLAVGFRLVLMSPLAFLARPARWLETIHHYRATISAAPNFAYELCAGKLDDRDLDGLDLSCWRLAYNGAEPVSPETIERFTARLTPHGFNPLAMTPVFGLAESSVGLAFPPLGRGPLIDCVDRAGLSATGDARPAGVGKIPVRRIVSCGLPLPGHAIRVVDAGGHELPERRQGRVQFQGPSATSGYFRNPEATRRLFDGPWLNTGDLGYLAGGELYLTGREKDIIIRGGHNIHPQELEEAVNRVPGVRRGGVAVFPAADARTGTERLVVLAETRKEMDKQEQGRIMAEIHRLAVDVIGMPVDDIVLAPPRTVLKTSSGKLRRAACRELYERGELAGARRAPWRQWLRLAGISIMAKLGQWWSDGRQWLWSVWAWTVFGMIVPVAWILIVLAPALGLRRRLARISGRLALRLTGLMPGVMGLEHLAGRSGVIAAANHASYLDALILSAVLPPRFAFVAKQELLRKPLAGIPLRRLGAAFVERFDSARGVEDTRALEVRARGGEALLFFPEGTFRTEPGLLPFRLGAFMVAARAGIPVAPVALTGSRALLPGASRWPRYSKLRVWIGAPLPAKGADWQAALQLSNVVRQRILAQLGEIDAAV